MGTHPIFESDFDCLTVRLNRSQWQNQRITPITTKTERLTEMVFQDQRSLSTSKCPRRVLIQNSSETCDLPRKETSVSQKNKCLIRNVLFYDNLQSAYRI